ncbi:MAG: PTS glucose transporter subunit IIA [Succinivibrionaceae bacterium]|nr:PTS glucose transporter subunit IIA [Succinivibrionaceae bacterium]
MAARKGNPIVAAMSGTVSDIAKLNEPIFAGKVVGDGVSILPSSGRVVAPISGVVTILPETQHSIGIKGYDGLEVLLHVGIDTVKLKGEGFTALVKVGDKVTVGQEVIKVDLALLRNRNYDTQSPLIVTSRAMDRIKRLRITEGECVAGETECMRYELNQD